MLIRGGSGGVKLLRQLCSVDEMMMSGEMGISCPFLQLMPGILSTWNVRKMKTTNSKSSNNNI